MNDNLDYFENIDKAIDHFSSASRDELISFLSSDDEILNQIALLNLNDIFSNEEAEKITFLLTGHSSETREYCAFLINRLMKNESYGKYFTGEFILNKFAKSVCDVNPKVCRKIIEVLPFFELKEELFTMIIKNSFEFIEELQEKNKDKNYQYNTKSFNLYWNIFALGYLMNEEFFNKEKNNIYKLLELLFEFREYTLREKGAYLIKKITPYLSENEAEILTKQYSQDENFYVKEIFSL